MLRRQVIGTALFALFLAGCSDEAPKPKAPEKPAEPVTGRYAFFQTYSQARLWSPDIQGLRVSSIAINEVKSTPGKSGAWEVVYVSPSKGKMRAFTYSTAEVGGNLHKGVFAGFEENFTPSRQAVTWPVAALKFDSDQAYETALGKSAAEVKKLGADTPMFYQLQQTDRFPDLVWRVVWGESVNTSKYSVFVDASTGQFLEKAH